MSTEYREDPRMPQPEQWLSEHPGVLVAIPFVSLGLALLLGWLL